MLKKEKRFSEADRYKEKLKYLSKDEEMRRIARQKGLSGMSLEEINEEIRLARRGE